MILKFLPLKMIKLCSILPFIAKNDGQLLDALKVNSEVTAAEAYNADNKVMNVVFNVETRDKTIIGYDLKQNTPNPF